MLDHLATHPDDTDARQVYADALSELGDPRGELIALELSPSSTAPDVAARVAALREQVEAEHAQRLSGESRVQLRWERGFVRAVEIDFKGDQPFDVIARLAAEPALRLLRRLAISAISIDGHGDFSPVIADLARLAAAFPCLVELEVTEGPDFGNPWIDGPVDLHDVTAVLRAYPRLERLVLEGDRARYGAAELPRLRFLGLRAIDREGAATLARVRAPSLEHLAAAFADQPVADLRASVDAVLGAGFAPTALSLAHRHRMAAVIARASATPAAARVRRLGFGWAQLDDAAVAALIAARGQWPEVVELRIAERACSADARRRIAQAFGVPIVTSDGA